MRIVIAPDSLKGGPGAAAAAGAIAAGWRGHRPDDQVTLVPLADGGEGTLDAVDAAVSGAKRHHLTGVTGPDGRQVATSFLVLDDGTAVVELAAACGLPLMRELDPLAAHTIGLGEVIAAALATGARSLAIGVGGSASTDAGMGALTALGLRLLDGEGAELPPGGAALRRVHRVDDTALTPPPQGGVEVLTDVASPLTGPDGAAAVFGPQKGASPDDVKVLDAALTHLAGHLGGDPGAPGAGAAGGAGYGFATLWGARLRSGSEAIAGLVGLDEAVAEADLVITGEGWLDATSFVGKVVGAVTGTARRHGTPLAVVAGGAEPGIAEGHDVEVVTLTGLAGGVDASLRDPVTYLRQAGAVLAERWAPPR